MAERFKLTVTVFHIGHACIITEHSQNGKSVMTSVSSLGDFLHFGQLFRAFGNN